MVQLVDSPQLLRKIEFGLCRFAFSNADARGLKFLFGFSLRTGALGGDMLYNPRQTDR